MYWKLGVILALFGLLGVSFLLLTSHPGVAIRISNFVFFVLLLSVLWGLFSLKK
ncbi:MAG: hypothetical protein ACOYT7_02150 [Patescibacteria group bacterium]